MTQIGKIGMTLNMTSSKLSIKSKKWIIFSYHYLLELKEGWQQWQTERWNQMLLKAMESIMIIMAGVEINSTCPKVGPSIDYKWNDKECYETMFCLLRVKRSIQTFSYHVKLSLNKS